MVWPTHPPWRWSCVSGPGLTAPLDAGVVVGRLVISSNGERIGTVKALAADTVEVPGTTTSGRILAGFIRSVAGLIGRG